MGPEITLLLSQSPHLQAYRFRWQPSVTENCHCRGKCEVSGHKNNTIKKHSESAWNAQLCIATNVDFQSNSIFKQSLNLADRKNTNHLDKCVSPTFWRGAIRIYQV